MPRPRSTYTPWKPNELVFRPTTYDVIYLRRDIFMSPTASQMSHWLKLTVAYTRIVIDELIKESK